MQIHYSYLVGSVYLLIFCAVKGELAEGFTYFNSVRHVASCPGHATRIVCVCLLLE